MEEFFPLKNVKGKYENIIKNMVLNVKINYKLKGVEKVKYKVLNCIYDKIKNL